MREEEIDKLLKNKINSEIKAPESLKSRISYEIKNIEEPKKSKTKLKIMQSVAAVVVVSVLGVTTYATVTKNPILEKIGLIKGSTTYEEIAKDINIDLSNEYADITLKRMASDNAYIIMEYKVNLKNSGIQKLGDIGEDTFSGYNIGISNTITINNEEIDITINKTEYANKISNTEFEIYQLINIANINSKNLDIEISEEYLTSNGEQIEINKIVSIQATKNENIEGFEKIENKIENKTITIENFQNTSFETFVKISVDITDVKESDMESIYNESYPNNIAFTVLDNQNNYISNNCYMKKAYIKDDSGNKIDILNSYNEENEISYNQATAHLEYIITLGNIDKNINEIKIVPFIYINNDERANDYEDYYNNLTWYKIQEGEYSQTGKLGGKIKINNIEVTDKKIKFSYTLSGFITGKEDMVLLRINDSSLGFNVIYPSNYYKAKINADEDYIEFDRNTENVGIYSYNFKDEEDYKLKDVSKIEFTLLAEPTIKLLNNEIKLTIPEQKESYLEINKIADLNSHPNNIITTFGESEAKALLNEKYNLAINLYAVSPDYFEISNEPFERGLNDYIYLIKNYDNIVDSNFSDNMKSDFENNAACLIVFQDKHWIEEGDKGFSTYDGIEEFKNIEITDNKITSIVKTKHIDGEGIFQGYNESIFTIIKNGDNWLIDNFNSSDLD